MLGQPMIFYGSFYYSAKLLDSEKLRKTTPDVKTICMVAQADRYHPGMVHTKQHF
jgi:hypothetical protein